MKFFKSELDFKLHHKKVTQTKVPTDACNLKFNVIQC